MSRCGCGSEKATAWQSRSKHGRTRWDSGTAGRLHVVTVAGLSPTSTPGELGTSYEQACAALRPPASPVGYGLILDLDDDGARWTRATTDVEGIRGVQSFWNTGLKAGYEPPDGTVAATLPGWPVDCSPGCWACPSRTTRPAPRPCTLRPHAGARCGAGAGRT
jgi:hypothetical protein